MKLNITVRIPLKVDVSDQEIRDNADMTLRDIVRDKVNKQLVEFVDDEKLTSNHITMQEVVRKK